MNNSVESVPGRSALGNSGHASQLAGDERMYFGSDAAAPRPAFERGHSLGIEEFGLRHLKTLPEIEKILYLREAIDLSVHSHAHTNFLALEKKETSAVSSGPSNCAGTS